MGAEYLTDLLLSIVLRLQRGKVTETQTSDLQPEGLPSSETPSASPDPLSLPPFPMLCLASPTHSAWLSWTIPYSGWVGGPFPHLQTALLLQGIYHCYNEIISWVIGSVSPLKREL